VLANYLEQFLRRDGRVLGYRGLEMAQQGRELATIAAFYRSCDKWAATITAAAGRVRVDDGDALMMMSSSECDAGLLLGNLPKIRGAAGEKRPFAFQLPHSQQSTELIYQDRLGTNTRKTLYHTMVSHDHHAEILRKRRAKALELPKSHPAYGCPAGNDEADLWHRTTGATSHPFRLSFSRTQSFAKTGSG